MHEVKCSSSPLLHMAGMSMPIVRAASSRLVPSVTVIILPFISILIIVNRPDFCLHVLGVSFIVSGRRDKSRLYRPFPVGRKIFRPYTLLPLLVSSPFSSTPQLLNSSTPQLTSIAPSGHACLQMSHLVHNSMSISCFWCGVKAIASTGHCCAQMVQPIHLSFTE